jgi:hypothetical protein
MAYLRHLPDGSAACPSEHCGNSGLSPCDGLHVYNTFDDNVMAVENNNNISIRRVPQRTHIIKAELFRITEAKNAYKMLPGFEAQPPPAMHIDSLTSR